MRKFWMIVLQPVTNFDIEEYIEEQLENSAYEWILVSHFDDEYCTTHGDHYHLLIESKGRDKQTPFREPWYRALDRKKTNISIRTGYRFIYEAIKYLTREKRVLISGSDILTTQYNTTKENKENDEIDNNIIYEEEDIDTKETQQGIQLRRFIELFDLSKCNNGYDFLRWAKNESVNIYREIFDHVYAKSRNKYMEWIDIAIQHQRDGSITWSWKETLERFEPNNIDEYHTVAKTRKILQDWCTFNDIDIWSLTEDIKTIIDKEQTKVNAILFMGESNAGKTIVANSVTDAFYRSSAVVNNASNCGFTWEKAVNSRVIKHEEATMVATQTEEYKQIMGGEACMINVKNKPMEKLERTPLIMTGNHEPWITVGESSTYENRCIIYERLKSNSNLKKVKKKLHP